MKLLNKILLLLVLIITGCTKPLIIRKAIGEGEGIIAFGINPNRNFYVNENLGDSLEIKWTFETNGSQEVNTSVTSYGNILFTPDLSGYLQAFSLTDGKLLGYEKFDGSIDNSPVINNLRLFFVVNNYDEKYSTFYFYDFYKGKVLVEDEIEGKCRNELIVLEDGILILTEQGKLIKYNFVGNRMWEMDTGEFVRSSPAGNENYIYFGSINGDIVSIDLGKKEIKFRNKIGNSFEGGISISGDNGFIGDIDGNLYSINLKSGNVNWTYDTGYKITATPAYDDKSVFIGNLNGDIYSINKISGKKNWKIETDGVVNITPLIFNDYVVQPDMNEQIYLIDVNTGEIHKTFEYDGRAKLSPVYYQGKLFLGVDRGKIFVMKHVGIE